MILLYCWQLSPYWAYWKFTAINKPYLPYKRVKSKSWVKGDNAHNAKRRAQIRTQPESTLSRAELKLNNSDWTENSPLLSTCRVKDTQRAPRQRRQLPARQQSTARRNNRLLEDLKLGYLRKLIPNPCVASPRIELSRTVHCCRFTQQCLRTAVLL